MRATAAATATSALFDAIYAGHAAALAAALARGADANGLEAHTGFTPLTLAIELGASAAEGAALLAAGADLHLANAYGATPLLSAVAMKQYAWIQRCLAAGACVTARGVVDDHLTSPAHEACYWGLTDTLVALVRRDPAVLTLRARHGLTPRQYMQLNETLAPQDFAAMDEAIAGCCQVPTVAVPVDPVPVDPRHMAFSDAELDDPGIDWTQRLNQALPRRDWPAAVLAVEMGAACPEYVRSRVHRARYVTC